ncbi:MAG: RidA family protein [Anaerolineae bacterium]|nr:RidA family protein [Anaerolineae bacterium]
MYRHTVVTDDAPKAIGPYSQAIVANGFVFCSGQIAIDPTTNTLVEGDVAVQARRVLMNLKALLEDAGAALESVVKTTVFLHNMGDFEAMNAVYAEFFKDSPPARSTVGNLNLPRGVLVEVEAIALVL